MLLLVCLALGIYFTIGECSRYELSLKCPTWMYPDSQNNKCECGSALHGAVYCHSKTLTVHLRKLFCIFFSEELNTTLVGTCPYTLSSETLPEDKCSYIHRTGQLCGECEENYTLPVYSYYLGCVKCEDYRYGWVKFIAVAFLPLTLFYIIVIIFRISATSSALNGYVLISQLFAIPSIIRMMYSDYSTSHSIDSVHTKFLADLIMTIYAIWNLDFFRSFYKSICLYPDLRYQQVLLLDYAVAVYPLLLIFITFICVKLHDNFTIVVWFWNPFHKCLVRFRKQWNIRSYLVNALATFIVLSYVKILNVSFEFLISSRVYNMEGRRINKAFWYYDGRVDMTSKEYLPYLVLALFMLLIFNIFPLVLLALYPFRYFQIFLDCCLSLKLKIALQIFMDTFHGCYKDSTHHDYRHFATLYLVVRFFNLLMYLVVDYNLYLSTSLLFLMFTLALVAKFEPYKCKRSNTVDVVLLFALIFMSTMVIMHLRDTLMFPKRLMIIAMTVAILIPPCYVIYLLFGQSLSKRWGCCKTFILNKFGTERSFKDQTLLNQGDNSNYHACH